MKKILFSIGSIAAVAAPIAAVVSCNDNTSSKWREVNNAEALANVVNTFAREQVASANYNLKAEDAQKIFTVLKKPSLQIQVFRDSKAQKTENGWAILVKGEGNKIPLTDANQLSDKANTWGYKFWIDADKNLNAGANGSLIDDIKDTEFIIRVLKDGSVEWAPVALKVTFDAVPAVPANGNTPAVEAKPEQVEFGTTAPWKNI